MAASFPLDAQDRAHFLHPFTSIPEQQTVGSHVMTEARGIRIRDAAGAEYIDAMAGLWCVNIGYGRDEVVRAIAEQSRKLPYYHSFMATANEPAIRLADRLAALAPGKLNRVFFGNSGSDANDTNIKIVWQYNNLRGRPNKKKIIARRGSYHGVTIAAASMSGLETLQRAFDVPLPGFLHVTRPHAYWEMPAGLTEREWSAKLAEEIEALILREGPDTIAAFAAEPVMGAGGVIVPPARYFEAVVPVLRKHDILLIADEVITGFGRLGRMFGSDHFGLTPDIMTLAKGLTSGYLPMSASVITDDIWQVLLDGTAETGQFQHGYTYSAHPTCAAAALANLDIIERDGLVRNAADTGAYFQAHIRERFAAHPLVGNVRGIGLIAAIELVQDKERKTPFDLKLGIAKRVYKKLLGEGLIARPIMNNLCFAPPLIVTREDVDEIIDRFARGLESAVEEFRRDGAWKD